MSSALFIWQHLKNFLEQGGLVLVFILLTTFLLWMLILERHYYFSLVQRKVSSLVMAKWNSRLDKQSWYAERVRERLISLVRIKAEKNLSSIKLIVVIAPLLGLLGTVVGMIDVFDVMALTSSSNSRGMASGVSKATIPTMAGMVVSLSGLLFSVILQRRSNNAVESLSNKLLKGEGHAKNDEKN